MKKIALVLTLVFAGLFANAQHFTWRLTYDVNVPTGEFKTDFISKWSWRGIGLDNRWVLNDKISVGFNFAWHTFYQRKDNILATSESGNFSAFGTQFRYLNTLIMQPNVHYYLGDHGRINPWVGLGIGTAYSNQTAELGFYRVTYNVWSFSLSPQVGVDIPLNMDTDFTIGGRYNLLLNSENQGPINFAYFGINAGFKFSIF